MTDSYSGLHDPYEDQLAAARYRAERDQAREELARIREDRSWDARADAGMLGAKEDRRAVEWVREHGGIEELRRMFQDADSRRVELCGTLGIDLDKGWSEAMAAMRLRLMPEGMEWPRYEDGEPVPLGGEVTVTVHDEDGDFDRTLAIRSIKYKESGVLLEGTKNEMVVISHGERVRRPGPKVLDADGVEIRAGDMVCGTQDMEPMRVVDADSHECGFKRIKCEKEGDGFWFYCPNELTHKLPVLAADDKPLREGETVYHVNTGTEYSVRSVTNGGAHLSKGDKPGGYCRADYLTHERPDSWERLEEDANKNPFDYCNDVGHRLDTCENSEAYKARDLVRRARALAERGQ